jgi:DNA-binding protein H-NS
MFCGLEDEVSPNCCRSVFGHKRICGGKNQGIDTRCVQATQEIVSGISAVSANGHENAMRKQDLTAMSFEELWQLHEELTKILADKVLAEKRELENRLEKLNRVEIVRDAGSAHLQYKTDRPPRRKYPKVLPKYRNPLAPSETWSGRGKRPRWLVAALETGQRLDDLKIDDAERTLTKERAVRGSRS